MPTPLENLKAHVCALSENPAFIHHAWFVEYHLLILEQLAHEVIDTHYPHANKEAVLCMVWLHDLGKILTNKGEDGRDETDVTLAEGRKLMKQFGFSEELTERVITDIATFESKMSEDISQANLEVQIASSIDGASHFIGPFFSLFWYENPKKSVEELISGNMKKMEKDITRKICLPEILEFLQPYIKHLKQHDPAFRKNGLLVKR